MNRFHESGAAGLANLRRGRPGHHRLPESLKLRVLSLIHEHYSDFGPTLAAEKALKCCLLVFIDDATSHLMHLRFGETESAFEYMMATREYLDQHGKPFAFYSHKHAIFRD